jgi:hypothetical protein
MDMAPFEAERRVALFVDGDNLSPTLAAPLLAAAGRLGRVDLRRVYVADKGPSGWEDAAAYRVLRTAGAKNGTDLLLCIEAVEVACQGRYDRFAIASDDRDFSHLAHWLRERGWHVRGLGTAKSPENWRVACSDFEIVKGPTGPRALKPCGPLADLDRSLRQAIGPKALKPMMQLGTLMSQAGMRPPHGGTWRAYMATRPDLYYLDPKGPGALVRWVGG